MITFCTAIELHPHANEIFPLQWSKAYHTCSHWWTKIMRNHSILVSIPSKFLKKKMKVLLSFVSFIFAACSNCSEEKSLMVPNPDPKQY